MIVVLAISLTLGPKIAVAASCLSGLPVMFQLLPTAIRKSERAFVLPFGLATFVGAPLGAMVLVALDPAIMKFVIAISSLGMTFLLFKGWRAKQAGNPVFLAGAGDHSWVHSRHGWRWRTTSCRGGLVTVWNNRSSAGQCNRVNHWPQSLHYSTALPARPFYADGNPAERFDFPGLLRRSMAWRSVLWWAG